MTLLHWYVLVGIPTLLLLGGYGAVRLAVRDAEKERLKNP